VVYGRGPDSICNGRSEILSNGYDADQRRRDGDLLRRVKYEAGNFELERLSKRSGKAIHALDDFITIMELMLQNAKRFSKRAGKGICALDDFKTIIELMLRNHRSDIDK
jgi:hypothetical protein